VCSGAADFTPDRGVAREPQNFALVRRARISSFASATEKPCQALQSLQGGAAAGLTAHDHGERFRRRASVGCEDEVAHPDAVAVDLVKNGARDARRIETIRKGGRVERADDFVLKDQPRRERAQGLVVGGLEQMRRAAAHQRQTDRDRATVQT
jgi:hypothetical protein